MLIPLQAKKIIALILFLCSHWAYAVNFGKIQPSEIGYAVIDLNTGEELALYRDDVAMNPASTMKLLTSYAALRELGSHYTWTTEFKSDAKVVNGILQGDLYWVGTGDPLFDQKDLLSMIWQLNNKGIYGINGRLVLDKSIWSAIGSADDFDDDADAAFTTPPDPQMLAFKVAWLQVEANESGIPQLKLDPAMPDVMLNTNITPRTQGTCRDIRNYLKIKNNGFTIDIQGSLPSSCIGKKTFVNILSMDDFALQSFKAHWLTINSTPLSIQATTGRAPANATALATHRSPDLAQAIKSLNKYSNNTIARTVFLTMGSKEDNFSNNTVASGKRAMRRTFAQAQLFDNEDLIIENGSGLSRRERVTPRFMGAMLKSAYDSPHRDAFIYSLPIAGVDGTLSSRFKTLGSNLRLKTGTLKNVRALAGYWLPENGRRLAVVVIINSPNSSSYLPDLDSVMTQLVRTYG